MLKFASSIGLALAVANLKRRIRHFVRSGILGGIGLAVLLIAVSFLLVALHLYLSRLIDSIASAAVIGGVLLVIALILFFIASRPMKARTKRTAADAPSQVADALREGFSRLGEAAGSAESPLRNPVLPAAGIALFIGYLLGRRRKDPEKD